MTSHDLLRNLPRAAETVADQGLDAIDAPMIDAVAARALMLGASTTLVDVLVDPDQPTVARIRAFGRLAVVAARPAHGEFALAA